MGIEFIILFICFIIYIILTEFRIYYKERNFDEERKSLIKSLLDEADVRKHRETQNEEYKLYLAKEYKKDLYKPENDLPEKVIYEDKPFEDSHGEAYKDLNKEIENYHNKEK